MILVEHRVCLEKAGHVRKIAKGRFIIRFVGNKEHEEFQFDRWVEEH